jgi:hypothetical protein
MLVGIGYFTRDLPVKATAGVPTEMVPYQSSSWSSVSLSLPVERFELPIWGAASGWGTPVLRWKVAKPRWILALVRETWVLMAAMSTAPLSCVRRERLVRPTVSLCSSTGDSTAAHETKKREGGEDEGGGELHGVDVEGERKRGRDDEASGAQVRAAYIRSDPMHSLLRSMRSDRLKPVQLHRLPRIGEGTSTGCDDRVAPECSQAILRILSE